ncbi:hypothetical protein BOX15_Mlig009925g2 [Macrostomum lignano]|uniref:RRM domain-containing protein n=1 Tax=Macrostomum lignano TaxID=282301 RepID=A0A267FU49_9PLAT|nr:hypothetical protein BOX15_Mlig009925g2 [Macrostomum lignano]
MSRGSKTVYVGNLPPDVRSKDIRDLFDKYGNIREIDLKNSRGPPFAFIEFDDERDAEDAVRGRDTYNFDGYSLRVEFPRSAGGRGGGGYGRDFGGRGGGRGPSRRGEFRVVVSGLPPSGSWQDLKDHMREAGEVGFADVRGSVGFVEFMRYEDMKRAIRKLDGTKFKSHEGETSHIRVKEDRGDGARSVSRSRSRSRGRRSPSRSRSRDSRSRSRSRSPPRRRSSPTYSPMRERSRSRSRSYSD